MIKETMFKRLNIERIDKRKLINIVKNIMKTYGIKPRKKYGQHFLIDPIAIRKILYTLRNSDRIIEIGPGIGVLTYLIAQEHEELIGIEIDKRFINVLRDISKICNNISIIICDALQFRIPENFTIFSNLPYYITSDILIKIVREKVSKAVITVQKEVADRLTASPGSSNYGRLTVLVQCFYNVRKIYIINRYSFYPVPEVDGCIIMLERRPQPCIPINRLKDLEHVTALLFSFRNKCVDKVLRHYLNVDVPESIKGKRVFQLTVDDIVTIVDRVTGA